MPKFIKLLLSNKFVLFLAVFGAVILGSVLVSGHAFAASASDTCGVNTGNVESDYAGLLVELYYKDAETGELRQANYSTGGGTNIGVTVWTRDWPLDGESPDVDVSGVKYNASDTRYRYLNFGLINSSNCAWGFSDNRLVVLGYGETSRPISPSADDPAVDDYALDCDHVVVDGVSYFQEFTLTGFGVPQGAASGGTWSSTIVAPPNGATTKAVLIYTEPAPSPPDWNYTIDLNINGSYVNATCWEIVKSTGTDPRPNSCFQMSSTVKNTSTTSNGPFARQQICSIRNQEYLNNSQDTCQGEFAGGLGRNAPNSSESGWKLDADQSITRYARYRVANDVPNDITMCVNAGIQPYKPKSDGYRKAGRVCFQSYNLRWGLTANVSISPASAYPGEAVTVTYKACNNWSRLSSAGATRGRAPNVSTEITGINGGNYSLPNQHVGANNCQEDPAGSTYIVRTQRVSSAALPGSSVCASMSTRGGGSNGRRRGYSDGKWFDNEPAATDQACITIKSRAPVVTLNANCKTMTYSVDDPDDSSSHNLKLQAKNNAGSWEDTGFSRTNESDGTYTAVSIESYINQYWDYSVRDFRLAVTDLDTAGQTVYKNDTIGPCSVPTCNVSTNPAGVEVGQSFTASSTINYSPGIKGLSISPSSFNMVISVADPSGSNVFLKLNADIGFTNSVPPTGTGGTTPNPITASSIGRYSVGSIVSNGTTTFGCTSDIRASNKPYLAFYGNDVFAGGGFADTSGNCTNVIGDIKTFLNPDNSGSGSQLAAFALGTINNFASAKLRSPPTVKPNPPNGLSFANTSSPPGNFGGSNCITEYPMDTTGITSPTIDFSNDGKYYYNGSTVIASGGAETVTAGKHISVYVNGNLTITNNIQYGGSDGWGDINAIPTIKFIVTGDIYIDAGVNRLNGIYVSKGTIYTCYDTAKSSEYANSELYDNCGNQLIVYGSLIANNIIWQRTYKSLRDATQGEHPYVDPANVNAAEVIISGPETYINAGGDSTDTDATEVYDHATNLPPIL